MTHAADPYAGRLAGLDGWRAMLMLGGLFMHATCGQEQRPFFDGVVLVSASFRMGAFFAISGFLNGLALTRRAPHRWAGRRLVQIGVPTAFGLTVLCPLMTIILFQGRPFLFDWHHLWFLVALTLYSVLGYAACVLAGGRLCLDRLCDHFGEGIGMRALALLGVAAAALVLMVVTINVSLATVAQEYLPMMWQARLIVGYAPLYLMGLALAHSPRLRSALLASPTLPAAIVGGVALAYTLWFGTIAPTLPAPTRQWLGDLIELAGVCICPPAASLLILKSAESITRLPRIAHTLRDASFTIYIVHYPLLIAMNLGFAQVGWNPYLEYALAVPAAGLLSCWFHLRFVRRSPILTLLLNGEARQTIPAPRLAQVTTRARNSLPKPRARFR